MSVERVPAFKEGQHFYIAPVLEQLRYWGINTEDDLKLTAAKVITELVKLVDAQSITKGELHLLAAGWVLEIPGRHRHVLELRAAADRYAATSGPEDDIAVSEILRRAFGLPPFGAKP